MEIKRRAVVAIVINSENKILVGKKSSNSNGILSGKWHILGETLKEGETNEVALERGLKEEADIKIKVIKHIAECKGHPEDTLVNWYECEALTQDIKPGSDLEEVRWVLKEEVTNICHEYGINLWPQEVQDFFKKP